MEFKTALEQFLDAISKKQMATIRKFLPKSGPMAGIMCDGTILDTVEDFLEFFDDWFEDDQWSITHDLVFVEESSEMAYGVTEGDYFDKDDDGEPYSLSLITTCIMRNIEGQWIVTLFQQTEANLDD
ncbi:nuclear transport factor 2 family protein [Pseudobacteriovorax antillogorgiicola]|uniref:SnoaL-like domain-containing protein n=1 Tax=Pseudobacteriovorax antillogorgiicola TaxID=1513793 RepID=A0A1Y6CDD7_9BACT|nr:nuclear transport factor 2 family protein [Pseudobacteriovorax antillogorgiicola]TCS47926.1 SnoaL-like protein [Pseudobacteriovorax antillogorgiicola]SMF57959.1 SnoaL-like domain-containing protein [Pseudobacteriovorax antillogorgiicola]